MAKKKKDDYQGDFGFTKTPIMKDQVVGIFELVGFSSKNSNADLVAAVSNMDMRIKLGLGSEYYWGERGKDKWESDRNEILLRSTGDGYLVAFSQDEPSLDALETLMEIYKGISKSDKVNLGINRGENYVLTDINGSVNIIGWGVNHAARALQFAENGQIICTDNFAGPILKTHDKISDSHMKNIGKRPIKEATIELYNYYKRGEFGAQLREGQKLIQ